MQQAALRAVDVLPSPRVVRIPGADHMVPVENPDDLARAIRDVIR